MIGRVLLFVVVIFFTSFNEQQGVEVSFINDSEETFIKMTIKTSGKEFSFSTICLGERTKAIMLDKTYWFIHTEAITQRDTVMFTGFCAVGETLIHDGNLLVSYTINPKNGEQRRLDVNEVSHTGSAKNVGFKKVLRHEKKRKD